MEAMFDDVGSKLHPREVKIHIFRENRRLGDPFWPSPGKGGDKPLPGWTPELDSVVLHGVQHSSGAAPD